MEIEIREELQAVMRERGCTDILLQPTSFDT